MIPFFVYELPTEDLVSVFVIVIPASVFGLPFLGRFFKGYVK